jgi:hypothetical protein
MSSSASTSLILVLYISWIWRIPFFVAIWPSFVDPSSPDFTWCCLSVAEITVWFEAGSPKVWYQRFATYLRQLIFVSLGLSPRHLTRLSLFCCDRDNVVCSCMSITSSLRLPPRMFCYSSPSIYTPSSLWRTLASYVTSSASLSHVHLMVYFYLSDIVQWTKLGMDLWCAWFVAKFVCWKFLLFINWLVRIS